MNLEDGPSMLQTLSLRRICTDIVRHIIRYESQAEGEKNRIYGAFRRKFSNEVVKRIVTQYASDLEHPWNSHPKYLDFIFNNYVKEIYLPAIFCQQEVMSTIARNCENLRNFAAGGEEFEPDMLVPLFNSVQHLISFTLNDCLHSNVELVESICSSLVHLQILNMNGSFFDDEGAYVLSGHNRPFLPDSIARCCFTGECGTQGPLRLRKLFLEETAVRQEALACILTHIPTLTLLIPTSCERYVVSEILGEIYLQRKHFGLPPLRLELTQLTCSIVLNWMGLFRMCPKLAVLSLIINDYLGPSACLDQALVQSDFTHLKQIILGLQGTARLITENMLRFWSIRGKHITRLSLCALHAMVLEFRTADFLEIAFKCANLKYLEISDAVLRDSQEERETLAHADFPDLTLLEELIVDMTGKPASVVALTFKLISAAKNLRSLELNTCVDKDILCDYLLRQKLTQLSLVSLFMEGEYEEFKYISGVGIIPL